MEIRIIKKRWEIKGYICDICNNKICKNNNLVELKGGEQWRECHMCQECSERVMDFIESIGGKVRKVRIVSDEQIYCPYTSCETALKRVNIDYTIEENNVN